jgi:hypothetical protein
LTIFLLVSLTVQNIDNRPLTLHVHDAPGRNIYIDRFDSGEHPIDVSHLAAGHYLIRILDHNTNRSWQGSMIKI